MDPDAPALWKMERFRDFLEARKELLAAALNRRLEDLLHGDTRWLASATAVALVPPRVLGGVTSESVTSPSRFSARAPPHKRPW